MLQNGIIYTLGFCAVIAIAFVIGWRYLGRERQRLATLSSYVVMKYRLGVPVEMGILAADVVDDIVRVENADDPMRRQSGIDGLWKRAVRLESSVDFWVDLLQKLGLLGTVLGLGVALAAADATTADLLAPLSMAVWTTVEGLVGGILISWRFGRDIDVEVDVHEEHLREWQAALARAGQGTAAVLDSPAMQSAAAAAAVATHDAPASRDRRERSE